MCENGDFIAQSDYLPVTSDKCVAYVPFLVVAWPIVSTLHALSALNCVHILYTILTKKKLAATDSVIAPAGAGKGTTVTSSKSDQMEAGSMVQQAAIFVSRGEEESVTDVRKSTKDNNNNKRLSKLTEGGGGGGTNTKESEHRRQTYRVLFFSTLCAFISNVCFVSIGVLKGVDLRHRVIGVDVPVTWIFTIGSLFFWMFCLTVFYLLLKSQLAAMQMKSQIMRHRLRVIRSKIYPSALAFSVPAAIAPLFMLIDVSSAPLFQALASTAYASVFFSVCIVGLFSWIYFIKPLCQDIQAVVNSNKLQKPNDERTQQYTKQLESVLIKAKIMIAAIKTILVLNAPVLLIFACVPQVTIYGWLL